MQERARSYASERFCSGGLAFLLMGCRCHGEIGSDLMMELLVIAGLNYLRRLSQFVDTSESSISYSGIIEHRCMKI